MRLRAIRPPMSVDANAYKKARRWLRPHSFITAAGRVLSILAYRSRRDGLGMEVTGGLDGSGNGFFIDLGPSSGFGIVPLRDSLTIVEMEKVIIKLLVDAKLVCRVGIDECGGCSGVGEPAE